MMFASSVRFFIISERSLEILLEKKKAKINTKHIESMITNDAVLLKKLNEFRASDLSISARIKKSRPLISNGL